MRGRVYVVFAEENTLCDPVDQTIGQHEIVQEIWAAVECLGKILPPIAKVIDERQKTELPAEV